MQNLWRRTLGSVLAVAAAFGAGAVCGTEPKAEVVVAIRYLQQTGTSHAHLYLYREDGRLLRQLTKDDGGQDRAPIFAPDGTAIVFTRELADGSLQWWTVEPRDAHLRRLEAAPEWYAQAKPSRCFKGADTAVGADYSKPVFFPAGGSAEVVLTPTPEGKKDVPDNPEEWYVEVRSSKDGQAARLPGKLPGWSPSLLIAGPDEKDALLQEGSWQTVFLVTSLGSTDGVTTHAVCLNKPEMARMARNWAVPYPLPGEMAFLSKAEERYVPFGNGSHTANCTYIDRWDAGLKRTRYTHPGAAALCYGASMYRPGKTPAVIIVPDKKDDA